MRKVDRLSQKGKLALTEFAGLERVVDKGKQVPAAVLILPWFSSTRALSSRLRSHSSKSPRMQFKGDQLYEVKG